MGNRYFVIDASPNVKEYLRIGGSLDAIRKACAMSEFQYLDRSALCSELEKDSGDICQDYIYERGIPLISEKTKRIFDEFGVDYLFYKKIILQKSDVGLEEPYWLALPPRINCLNLEESEIDEILNVADEIVINDSRVGRYDIFKLAGVTNLEIIITEKLAVELKKHKLIGMHIYPIE